MAIVRPGRIWNVGVQVKGDRGWVNIATSDDDRYRPETENDREARELREAIEAVRKGRDGVE